MELATLVLFGFALSVDSFGAGLAYGLQRIRMPLPSLLVIGCLSTLAVGVSLGIGNLVASATPATMAEVAGGILLILIGLVLLCQTVRGTRTRIFQVRIAPLGLVIQVLLEPLHADLDRSGAISLREAVLLGLALAMDSFAAGFALGLIGPFSFTAPFAVGAGTIAFTALGLTLGRNSAARMGRKLGKLPGCLLIALGVFRLVRRVLPLG
ncbi:MAG: sporulation membrane protein YtaF [Bacillota bacterium]